MNTERLQIQIDVLHRVMEAELPFNMGAWLEHTSSPCATAACAFGYAALDPRLQAEGLSLYAIDGALGRVTITSVADYNRLLLSNSMHQVWPTYAGLDAFAAASKFYGISRDAARFLFDPECYEESDPIFPEDVIKRIEYLLDNDGNMPPEDDDDGDC